MTIGLTAHARPGQRASAVLPRPNDPPRTTARSTARPGACAGATSINAQPVNGKSLGIASHAGAPLMAHVRMPAHGGRPPRFPAGHLISHVLKGALRWQISPPLPKASC